MAKKQKKKKKYRGLKLFLELQAVLILIVIGVVTYYYVGGYATNVSKLRDEALKLVKHADESTFRSVETSIVYDSNGDVLSILKGEKDVYYLEYSEIPIYVKEAIISIEDKKFYNHKGVDYKGIIRAAYAMVRNGKVTQGASTITQQLARTVFLTQDRTWERKIEEIYIALELEKRFSKNQLLEYYLNNIYFANGFYGIEAASRGYFSVPSQELSLSQIAFLCAIPNSPTRLDPVEDPTSALSRRNLILRNMLDDGIISETEYQKALLENIILNMSKRERHNYQETYTYYCATRALMEMEGFKFQNTFLDEVDKQEYEEEYSALYSECNTKLYENGYRIYTSLDSDMQKTLQDSLDEQLKGNTEVNADGIYELQGSAVCIDNETGMVKAIVGGREQDYEGYTLNRAYQSFRQPGSAIKPLIVYTPALESGFTAETIVEDKQIEDGPSNSGGGYSGKMTLRRAVELSKNTVAWQIMQKLSPKKALSYLEKMGFDGLEKSDEVYAIALGGFTKGVSALEMAEGFATIENDGYFRRATCITMITDTMGNILYQPEIVGEPVYRENATRQMTDILKGVFTSPGATAVGLGLKNMDCAGKTGTTNDNKDGWFVGYTPYYTTAVWVGYDNPKRLKGLWGSTMPGRIWNNYMTKIHRNLPNKALNTYAEELQETPEDTYIQFFNVENTNEVIENPPEMEENVVEIVNEETTVIEEEPTDQEETLEEAVENIPEITLEDPEEEASE